MWQGFKGIFENFSFSSQNCELSVPNPLFLSKIEHVLLQFSFSSQNWRKEFQVSLSSLKTGEKNFNFSPSLPSQSFGLSPRTDMTWDLQVLYHKPLSSTRHWTGPSGLVVNNLEEKLSAFVWLLEEILLKQAHNRILVQLGARGCTRRNTVQCSSQPLPIGSRLGHVLGG